MPAHFRGEIDPDEKSGGIWMDRGVVRDKSGMQRSIRFRLGLGLGQGLELLVKLLAPSLIIIALWLQLFITILVKVDF